MNFKLYLIFTLTTVITGLNAQSFDLEQATQLIRPRLKTEGRIILNANFKDTSGNFNLTEQSLVLTFPLKRKFSADIALNLKSLKPKELLKNSIRIKACDILGNIRITSRQLKLGIDSLPAKNIYGINAGITGLHLTKKYRIAFYSVNAHLLEQDKYLSAPALRLSALGGLYHVRGLRKSFYYGAALVYSDGLLLPAPFIGGTERLFRNWYFNYTLPVQLNIEYNDNKHRMLAGVKADGFRSSLSFKNLRRAMNYTQGMTYIQYRYRFSNTFYAHAEGGYIFYHKMHFASTSEVTSAYHLKGKPYIQAGFFAYFGKGLLEKIIEQLF